MGYIYHLRYHGSATRIDGKLVSTIVLLVKSTSRLFKFNVFKEKFFCMFIHVAYFVPCVFKCAPKFEYIHMFQYNRLCSIEYLISVYVDNVEMMISQYDFWMVYSCSFSYLISQHIKMYLNLWWSWFSWSSLRSPTQLLLDNSRAVSLYYITRSISFTHEIIQLSTFSKPY